MILDRGIATFFRPDDEVGTGNLAPQDGTQYHRGWYGERTVGATRHFAAKQANDRVDMLIRILRPPEDRIPLTDDVCVTRFGYHYRVTQVQLVRDDESGEDVVDISLERISEKYGRN